MKVLKILIIENDEDEQFFISKGFLASGLFEITNMLYNGDDIIENLASKRPDIILSDLNMPGKNGYEILVELKASEQYSSIPIIITSNDATPTILEKCKSLGAYAIKSKPVNFRFYDTFAKTLYDEVIGLFPTESY